MFYIPRRGLMSAPGAGIPSPSGAEGAERAGSNVQTLRVEKERGIRALQPARKIVVG